MKYRYFTTPQGKALLPHRFTAEEKHTVFQRIKDSSGTEYHIMLDGSHHRANPKPYRGKSGRRARIKNRREIRERNIPCHSTP